VDKQVSKALHIHQVQTKPMSREDSPSRTSARSRYRGNSRPRSPPVRCIRNSPAFAQCDTDTVNRHRQRAALCCTVFSYFIKEPL